MIVARCPEELERRPRAVAIGTFDGVHRGHRSVIRSAVESGLDPTVVTFDPHPRVAMGNRVELISTLERRLELLEEVGATATLIVPFTPTTQALDARVFIERYLLGIGAEALAVGSGFRFGRMRTGDAALAAEMGLRLLDVTPAEGVSSTAIRGAVRAGDVTTAARMLGRPFELDGVVVVGDRRGTELGFPTANIALDPARLCPGDGIYAGWARGHRVALSIGTNPHFGGSERRIEPYLLDFDADLYGERLVVEVWERLREERVFETDAHLVAQIALDVEATRGATRPS